MQRSRHDHSTRPHDPSRTGRGSDHGPRSSPASGSSGCSCGCRGSPSARSPGARSPWATQPEGGMATILAERASLDMRPVPRWYTASMRDLTAGKDTRGRIPYAEFYLNALRVPGSATARHHQATYGPDVSYFDFRDRFERSAAAVDLGDWARCFAGAGARYVVMVTRHLDGYPLWPTKIANPHMPLDYRSRRDLVGDLTEAVRAQGLRMGLYYGGGLDWTFTDKPIRTMADLMCQQALGPQYARYATARWTELVHAYQPSVLWNDMGRPVESDPHQLFTHYYEPPGPRVVPVVRLPVAQGAGPSGPVAAQAASARPLRLPHPRVRHPRPGAHRSLGADPRPGPILRVQRQGDRRRHPHRHPAHPPARRCRRPRRQPAHQRRTRRRRHLRHPTVVDRRDHHRPRPPGPLHPEGRHHLRHRLGGRPHRQPHHPRPDPPPRQPGRHPQWAQGPPLDPGRQRRPDHPTPTTTRPLPQRRDLHAAAAGRLAGLTFT